MLSNNYITSLIARSVLDIEFLNQLGSGKYVPADIQNIRYVSAFITKVKHNFLWNNFPLSRQLLINLKKEIEIYSAYLEQYQKNSRTGKLSVNEKIKNFNNFLLSFLHGKKEYEYRVIYNVLLHEITITELKTAGNTLVKARGSANEKKPAGKIPFLSGTFKIVSLYIKPDQMEACIFQNRVLPLLKRPVLYCYWADTKNQDIRIFRISKNISSVLYLINSNDTVRQIQDKCKNLMLKQQCRSIIVDLHRIGIINYP